MVHSINHTLDRIIASGDPLLFGKPLAGDLSGFWRSQVGKYRLICDIQKSVLLIEIIQIGKREWVYG